VLKKLPVITVLFCFVLSNASCQGTGIATEFYLYRNVGHGFGLGTGTSAEGWVDNALRFWENHRAGDLR
jgi:hypothetical protein